jgi:hypothetical protein
MPVRVGARAQADEEAMAMNAISLPSASLGVSVVCLLLCVTGCNSHTAKGPIAMEPNPVPFRHIEGSNIALMLIGIDRELELEHVHIRGFRIIDGEGDELPAEVYTRPDSKHGPFISVSGDSDARGDEALIEGTIEYMGRPWAITARFEKKGEVEVPRLGTIKSWKIAAFDCDIAE